jgi:hypothetical protein
MSIDNDRGAPPRGAHGLLGSLREALAAAGRDEPTKPRQVAVATPPPAPATPAKAEEHVSMMRPQAPSAAEAAREARGGTPNIPPGERSAESEAPPTTRVLRGRPQAAASDDATARTQFVRGKQSFARQSFHTDPVVGWLVIVGGPGLGAHRSIYEGNNTIGRAKTQRIAIDFGDDSISSEEQAYIRYEGSDRSFLFVPNLAKTNVVAVNDKRPTSAVTLQAMDVITMGRTQLVFVPFCGPDFDWADISENKA